MPISDQLKGALSKYSTQYKDDTVQGKFVASEKQAAAAQTGKFGGNKKKPEDAKEVSDDRVLDLMDQYETTATKNAQKDVEATKSLQQTVSKNHQTTEDNADFRATTSLTQDKAQNKQLGRLNSTVGDLYRLLYNEIHKPNVGRYTSKHKERSPEIDDLAALLAQQHKELMRKLGDCCGGGGGIFGGGLFGRRRDRMRRGGRDSRGPGGPDLDVDIDNDRDRRDRRRDRQGGPDLDVDVDDDRDRRDRRRDRNGRGAPDVDVDNDRERRGSNDADTEGRDRRTRRPRVGGRAKIAALVGGGALALGAAVYMGKKHQEEYPEETAEQNRREDEGLPELEGQELIDFRSNITRKQGNTPDPSTGYAITPTQKAAVDSGQYTVEQALSKDESDLYDELKAKGITAQAPTDTSVGTAAAVAAGAAVTAGTAYALMPKAPAAEPPAPPPPESARDVAAAERVAAERAAAEQSAREAAERAARATPPTPPAPADQTAREAAERTSREAAEQTAREAAESAARGGSPAPVPEGGSWWGKASRWAGRLVTPAVTAYDAYGIVTDEAATASEKAGELTDLAGGVAGGWAGGEAGAAAGGALGLLGGPFAPVTVPLGAFIGGVGGGILGYMGGEALTEKARESLSAPEAEDVKAQPVTPTQPPKEVSAAEPSVDRMAELKQQDVKQAADVQDPAIDFTALDKAVAGAAQFASAGSAATMSDVTTLADPNSMISGVLGKADATDVTSQPIATTQPIKTVEASETETQAKQNELIKEAVKKVNELGPDKKTVGVPDVNVNAVTARSPEFRVIGEAVAEKIDDVKGKATEIGKDGSAIAVINAVGNIGTFAPTVATPLGASAGGAGYGDSDPAAGGGGAVMGSATSNRWTNPGGFVPGSQGTPSVGGGGGGGPAIGGGMIGGGAGGGAANNVRPTGTGTTEVAKVSTDQEGMMKNVYSSFTKAGFSEAQSKALTAEVGRENGFQSKYIFGDHGDAANAATNTGFFSWQGDRKKKLQEHLASKGLMKDGKMVQSQESLDAMAEFAKGEMESGQYKGLGNFMENKNVDSETAAQQLGKGYIKWAYGQDKLRSGASFDWRAHDKKRAGYYNKIDQMVGKDGKPGAAGAVAGAQQPGAPGAADVTSTQATQGGASYKSMEEYAAAAGYGAVGDGFGPRIAPNTATGKGSSNHKGVDIKPKTRGENVPIKPLEGGVVESASTSGGYGNSVVVKHPDGTTSRYSHLNNMSVKPGDTIGKDTVLGNMGTTGNSSGVHLHTETTDAQGNKVDPNKWLAQRNAAQQSTPQDAQVASSQPVAPAPTAQSQVPPSQAAQNAPQAAAPQAQAPQATLTASTGAGAAALGAASVALGGVDVMGSINAAKADQRSFVPPPNTAQTLPSTTPAAVPDPQVDFAALDASMSGAAKFAATGDANTMSDVTTLADPKAMTSGVLNQPVTPAAPVTPAPVTPTPAQAPLAISNNIGKFGFGGEGEALEAKKGFIMHHTGGRGDAESVKQTLQERKLATQYIIDREGKVTRVLPEGTRGAHMKGGSDQTELNKKLGLNNTNTEGVEIIANDDKDVLPVQVEAAARLAAQAGYKPEQVYGHGELNSHKQETEGGTAAKRARDLLAGQTGVASGVAEAANAATQAATTATQAAADVSQVQQTSNAFVGSTPQGSTPSEGGPGAAALGAASSLFGGANVLGLINSAKADQARMYPGAASSYAPTANGGITANAGTISAGPMGASAGMMCNAASQPTPSSPTSPLGASAAMSQTAMPSCPGAGGAPSADAAGSGAAGSGIANTASNLLEKATGTFTNAASDITNTIAPSFAARSSSESTTGAEVSAQGGGSSWTTSTPYASSVSSQTVNETPAQREKHASVQTVRVADGIQTSGDAGQGRKELPQTNRSSSAESYSPKNNQSTINETPTLVSDFGLTFLNAGFI